MWQNLGCGFKRSKRISHRWTTLKEHIKLSNRWLEECF